MTEADELRAAGDDEYRDKWIEARDRYLLPLLERYEEDGQGRHEDEVRDYLDQIEMHQAMRQAQVNAQFGREPRSEGERLYREARKYEEFGDRVTALEKYRSMVELLKGREKERPFVNAARYQIAQIGTEGADELDRIEIVEDALDRADKLFQEGRVLKARQIWRSIVTLYAGNAELQPQVEAARSRLETNSTDQAGPS